MHDSSMPSSRSSTNARNPPLWENTPAANDDVSETTEESYAKVPVEKFGLAMLRGMGWKGNVSEIEKKKITKDEESKQRPLLLGLGAKPSSIQLDPSYRFSSANYEPLTKVPKNSGRSSRI